MFPKLVRIGRWNNILFKCLNCWLFIINKLFNFAIGNPINLSFYENQNLSYIINTVSNANTRHQLHYQL